MTMTGRLTPDNSAERFDAALCEPHDGFALTTSLLATAVIDRLPLTLDDCSAHLTRARVDLEAIRAGTRSPTATEAKALGAMGVLYGRTERDRDEAAMLQLLGDLALLVPMARVAALTDIGIRRGRLDADKRDTLLADMADACTAELFPTPMLAPALDVIREYLAGRTNDPH
jgi:hypothetical protein